MHLGCAPLLSTIRVRLLKVRSSHHLQHSTYPYPVYFASSLTQNLPESYLCTVTLNAINSAIPGHDDKIRLIEQYPVAFQYAIA